MVNNDNAMEKIYLNWILDNPDQINKVEPYFFTNDNIRIVYNSIKDEYVKSNNKVLPQSLNQAYAIVRTYDEDERITKDFIKKLLTNKNDEYEQDFILRRFKSWKLSNYAKKQLMESVDYMRKLDTTDYDVVSATVNKIKLLLEDISMVDDDDSDMGEDFDDIESHLENDNTKKIPSGWSTLDKVLDGGWDQASLNCLMGQTSVGKSMWMQNMAVKLADQGANVVYITLEMSSAKCMRRMGSMRLDIPYNDYLQKIKDGLYFKNKLNSLKQMNSGLFNTKPGKIRVKKYNTSDCTITDLNVYLKKLTEKNETVNVVFVDYINLMALEKGFDFSNMLYLKGKHLAEGLRYLADKYNCCFITATQVAKDVWEANDLELKDIPESKAIVETCDTFFGIIRNPEMKKNNKYRLKILKLRDGEHNNEQIRFDFNPTYLKMENDEFVG